MKFFSTLAALLLLAPSAAFASSTEDVVGTVEVCPGVLKVEILERGNLHEFYESVNMYQAPGEAEAVCQQRLEAE